MAYNTYLSAKNVGFTGSYTDWVDAGRPSADELSKGQSNLQGFTDFPKLTYTDNNGNKQTWDPNSAIQQRLVYGPGNGMNTGKLMRPQDIIFSMGNIDRMLDPNFSKNVRPVDTAGRGDLYFRGPEDIDYNKFDDPDLARKVLGSYLTATQNIGTNLQQKMSDPRYQMAVSGGGQRAIDMISSAVQDSVNQAKQTGIQQLNAPAEASDNGYGVNPRTGEPLSPSQAFSFARQNEPGLTWSEFQNKYPAGSQELQNLISQTPTRADGSVPELPQSPGDMLDMGQIQQIQSEAFGTFEQAVNDIVSVIKDLLPANVDPLDLTDAELDDIMREAEATVGPEFTRIRERAEQDFAVGQRFAQENLQKVFNEAGFDVGEKKQRIARNFQEALADSQAAMANRQLTFGGTRQKAERKLETARSEMVSDVEKEAGRKLGAAQQEFERGYGSRALPELPEMDFFRQEPRGEEGVYAIGQQRTLADIARETEQQTAIEFERRKANRELPI